LRVRFDYGSVTPWVRRTDDGLAFVAGAEALRLRTPVASRGENFTTVSDFEVGEGDVVPFELTWHESHLEPPKAVKVEREIAATEKFWTGWSKSCRKGGEWD